MKLPKSIRDRVDTHFNAYDCLSLHVFTNGIDEWFGLHELTEAIKCARMFNRENGCVRVYLDGSNKDDEQVEETYLIGHGEFPW